MLSSVLRSRWAIQVNIQIMRAFTQLRGMLAAYEAPRQRGENRFIPASCISKHGETNCEHAHVDAVIGYPRIK